jgi:RNA-directed DNA polymerase
LNNRHNEGKQMTVSVQDAQATRAGAGAPSHPESMWLQSDWKRIASTVRRLQVRIAKATKEGRWGKVQALQRLLTRSYSGKMLAVKRVTENRGRRTPGVDGRIWSSPAAKSKGMKLLQHRGYRPQPLRRIYIPKSNGKERPLGIPTMLDRAMQALWKLALEPVAETRADRNSYGFRLARSTADAIAYCFTTLSRKGSAKWILEGDIRGCYDNISHEWLLRNIPMDKVVLRRWLKAGYIEMDTLFATEAGTPQGGVISPVLATMTLDGLEEAVLSSVAPTDRTRRRFKVHVVRYADDFAVTAASQEILTARVRPAVAQFLAVRGLELSEEKTRITHIDQGFDFLGQNVRKYAGKLLIKPAKKSVMSLLATVREVVRANASATQANLLLLLNPIIRGWANYHRHVVSKARFSWIDSQIWYILWKWAVRRHPMKPANWVKGKYFHVRGFRHWVFATKVIVNGCARYNELFAASRVAIVRHVKIQCDANPFDRTWDDYFARRAAKRNSGVEPGLSEAA